VTALVTLASIRSGGGLPTPLVVVAVVAGVGYVLWRRLKGEPVQTKRLLVLPAVFTILGVVDLTKSGAPPLSSADIAFLAAGAAISFALGAARGATIDLFPRGGYLHQRYRKTTVALWAVLVAVKLALDLAAHAAGATAASGSHSLMLALGVSLLGEAVLVAPRALATGVPFAPDPKRQGGNRPGGPFSRAVGNSGQRETTPAQEWDNDRVAPRSPASEQAAGGGEEWRSPGWRDGLAWVRGQLDQPPTPSLGRPRRRRRR
jgi:hypothetical protein